jgi:CBS domain-containing protein
MRVGDLKLEPLLATSFDESISEAADRMRFYEIGSLGILEGGSLVGVFTERDVVKAVADRSDLQHLSIRAYATSSPTTVTMETDVEEAAELMLSLDVRHLPVVEGIRPVGMVSIKDVLAAELALSAEAV